MFTSLTGPTVFSAESKAVDPVLSNITQIHHRPQTIELVGLEGGHFYDVWIEACVADQCKQSKSLVKEIECEHKCSDGTCIHWNAKCNYIRECPGEYFFLLLKDIQVQSKKITNFLCLSDKN